MKAKKSKIYKKSRKFVNGTQEVNPNIDPTLQYQTNRGQSAKDMQFNNAQQSLLNRDINQQQYNDKTNKSLQDLNNVSSSTQGARSTASGIASALGPVGMAIGAGIGVAGGIGDSLNKKVADKELAGGKRDYATRGVANVIDPTTNLIQGLGLDGGGMNGSDLLSGLTAGLVNVKGSKEDKAIDAAKYAKSRQDYSNNQITQFGNVDTKQQALQAKNGLKKVYKKGSSGIYIKPENRGKFNSTKEATGKTTEELTHSSNPITKKRAIFAQNAAKWKHEKGSKKLNTRIIETEGREPIFSPKDSKGNRKLVYYNPSDPTHKEGGVKAAIVETGKDRIRGILNIPKDSAIVTAKGGMNKKAIDAYTKGDKKILEKVINSMPSDNKSKKYDGNKKLGYGFTDKDGKSYSSLGNTFSPSIEDDNSLLDTGEKGDLIGRKPVEEMLFGKDQNISLAENNTVPLSNTNKNSKVLNKSSFLNKTGTGLAQAAPSIYNLGKGIFEKPQQTNRRYMSNEGFKYKDTSNPLRRAANEQARVESDNIRNATGGSGGSFLANQALASANRFKNVADINNQESAKRMDVRNSNTNLRNQQRQTNLGLANQYDDLDLQNKAAKTGFLTAGLTGLSDLSFNKQLMNNQANADRIRANTLETDNYKYNTKDEKNVFKAKGTKKLKGNKSIRYKNK